ncbi:unnamed protein product [Urochloa decumbens]|uniref:Uncharacterized protein n=1 Tax=Urochloa decumbens TaxID=240449 RepID=A0ABC9B1N7_9POAL
MEATALSVGKSVLKGALGYAKSAFAEEVVLQLGIQRDHAFVADELEMMQSFMMEAHEERDNNKVVKTWVKQVRDTAYDVEDSLQDFAVRLQSPSWWRFPRTLLERRRVAKQMKELRAKVEDVSHRNVRYRLIKGSGSKAIAATEQSSIIAASIFGVDDARRAAEEENHQRVDLVQLINKEADDLKVMAVWGTSGDIGQTTIIREAYENTDVQIKFPCRAWFHATEGVEILLKREKTEQDLAHEFNGYVNEKRCLIVLNDLSTIEEWDQIKKCFQNNKKGSRIVVSTSQVEVASLCAGQESQPSELKQLSPDQTLYAFCDKGSQNGKDSVKPASRSDMATSSTKNYAVSLGKIMEDGFKDADGKKVVKKSKDSVKPLSSLDTATTNTNNQAVALGEITEVESKDADKKKVVAKSLTRIRTGVGASEESQLIRREREILEVIDLILNKGNQKGQVISVWGMGGLGKTTLVSGVYYSPKLSDKFEKRVFVSIMRPFNPAEHLRRLIGGLHEGSATKEDLLGNSISNKRKSFASMGVEELTKEVAKLLETKSCLIVLDDLSSTAEWDLIIPKFPQIKTSRIIVTTRYEIIAKHCIGSGKHGTIHNLKVLEPEDALHLFNKKVFGEARDLVDQKNPELVKEAKQILKKCGGLPLAIVFIGGFLANRPKTGAEWRKLNDNISAELEMNPELGMIRTVLAKSYDGLPYELKSCFLYLSIFPEDHIISRRRLGRRWTAEGYSSERRGKSAIEIAENYFTELKNRSMTLPFQRSVQCRKSIDSCKVHDLIRDITISKSIEENLVFRQEESCGLSSHGVIRHLAISSNWKGDQSEFESIVDLTRIRSLTLFGNFRSFYISDKMRLLRVLDLEGIDDLEYHQLDNIWKLLHLKYLSLRGCYRIGLLPDSLGNLRQLQSLDVRNTCVKALPKTIIKLQKLQYIHAGQKSDYLEEKDSLTFRCYMGACLCATCCLPLLWAIGGPLHMSLTSTMGKRAVLHDIKMLTGLRKLGVAGINKKNGPAFRSAISNLKRLESLSVISSAWKQGLRGCLDDISSPPENLRSLKLYGNLETLPEWIKELPHLVKLKLVSTRLLKHDAAMEFLGKLPKLEILVLSESWSLFQREELDFKSPQAGIAFGSLRVLRFGVISKVRSVKFEQGAMPKLERLLVTGEVNNELVSFSGLESLPSINEIQLYVYFPWDEKRIRAAPDSKTQDRIWEEEGQEQMRKKGELKKKIQEQLAGNTNEPIVTLY